MAVRISQNIAALVAYRNLGRIMRAISKSIERLSTGYRINQASDDPAGLGISEGMRAQVRGLAQAERNIMDAVSLVQTAEAGLTELVDMIQRIRELAVQAANATYTSYDRTKMQLEVDQITSEISRLASAVVFNTKKILTGMSFTFQVGANYSDTIALRISTVSAKSLGLWDTGIGGYGLHSTALFGAPSGRTVGYAGNGVGHAGISGIASAPVWSIKRHKLHIDGKDYYYEMGVDISSKRSAAESALVQIDSALHQITLKRAHLGAFENRLYHTLNFVGAMKEQMVAAQSRIRDLDIASEMMQLTRNQILLQAATSILAQANTLPGIALLLI